MEPILIIAIVLAVLIVGFVVFKAAQRRAADKQRERDRIRREAEGHREVADSNVAKAQELGPRARAQREIASEHERKAQEHEQAARTHHAEADKLEQKAEVAGRAATRHDDEAARREERRGD